MTERIDYAACGNKTEDGRSICALYQLCVASNQLQGYIRNNWDPASPVKISPANMHQYVEKCEEEYTCPDIDGLRSQLCGYPKPHTLAMWQLFKSLVASQLHE